MGNVNITNELSSRPERSEVEGPAVPSTGIQFDRETRLFIRSSLSCLRQVARGMNSIHRQLLPPLHPMRAPILPFVIPSGAEESAVSASQYQMLTGETVLFIGSIP